MNLYSHVFVGVIGLSALASAHSQTSVLKGSVGVSDLTMSVTSLDSARQKNPTFIASYPFGDSLILRANTATNAGAGHLTNVQNADLSMKGTPFDASSGNTALSDNLATITKAGNSASLDFDIPLSSFEGQTYGVYRGTPTGGTYVTTSIERDGLSWKLSPYSSVTISGVFQGQLTAQPEAVVGLTGGNTLRLSESGSLSATFVPTVDATPEQARISGGQVAISFGSEHHVSDTGVLLNDGTKTIDEFFSISIRNPTGTDMPVSLYYNFRAAASWNLVLNPPPAIPELNTAAMWFFGLAALYGVRRKRACLDQ